MAHNPDPVLLERRPIRVYAQHAGDPPVLELAGEPRGVAGSLPDVTGAVSVALRFDGVRATGPAENMVDIA